MKTFSISTERAYMVRAFTILSAFLLFTGTAQAAPATLNSAQLDGVTAGATTPYSVLGSSPVFVDSGMGSLQNTNNTALRFGAGGAIAIPGSGAGNANSSSAVSPYSVGGSGGLVTPPSFN